MSLESLTKRIKTTEDLRNIVSTMKLLSSVSISPYEKALESLKNYGQTIEDAFLGLFLNDGSINIRTNINDGKKIFIFIGTDNGLVGRFNKELLVTADQYLSTNHLDRKNVVSLCIGKRIGALSKNFGAVHAVYAISNSLKEIASIASTILSEIEKITTSAKVGEVILFFNQRLGIDGTKVQTVRLMPMDNDKLAAFRKRKWAGRSLPLITADYHELFSQLVHEYLTITLSRALTASLAAEHYTRMINMQQAEKNIDESLEKMNLDFQQVRQTSITDELIDIVSGAESMRPKKK